VLLIEQPGLPDHLPSGNQKRFKRGQFCYCRVESERGSRRNAGQHL
jgi:hypothetical protein